MKAFITTLDYPSAIEAVSLIQERDSIALHNSWLTGWTRSLGRMIALRQEDEFRFTLALHGLSESINFWGEIKNRLDLPDADHQEVEEIDIPERFRDVDSVIFTDDNWGSPQSSLRPSSGVLAAQLNPIFGFHVEQEMLSRSEVTGHIHLYFREELAAREGAWGKLHALLRETYSAPSQEERDATVEAAFQEELLKCPLRDPVLADIRLHDDAAASAASARWAKEEAAWAAEIEKYKHNAPRA